MVSDVVQGDRPASSGAIVGVIASWVLGLSGALASIRGWGDVVVHAPVQDVGEHRLALVTASWLVLASAVGPRPVLRAASWVAALAMALELTAANVGRAPAVVASISTLVAHAALVPPARPGRWPHRSMQVAWPALLPLGAAQVLWVRGAGLAPTVATLALALLVVDAHHRFPGPASTVHRPVVLLRQAGRVAARATRTRGLALWRVVTEAAAAAPGRTRAYRAEIGAAAASVVLLLPTLYRYASESTATLGSSDYATHIHYARLTPLWPPIPTTPHFLFHLSVSALAGPLGIVAAATVVSLTAAALLAVVLVRWTRRPFAARPGLAPGWGVVLAVGYVLLESPNVIAAALRIGSPYDWAPTFHMLLSPTDTLLVPFAVVLLVLVADAIAGRVPMDAQAGRRLAASTVMAALAKPSMNLVLLVAVPLYLVLKRRLDRRLLSHLGRWFVAPSLVVVAAQTWLLEAGTDALPRAEIAFRPLDTIRSVHLDRSGPLLLVGALVVPLCLWAGGRRYVREPAVAVSLLAMGVGIALLALVNETGVRRSDGTFTKPAFMCGVVLHLVSWRFLLGELASRPRGRPPGWVLATGVFAVTSAVAGVLALLSSSGWIHLAIRSGSY